MVVTRWIPGLRGCAADRPLFSSRAATQPNIQEWEMPEAAQSRKKKAAGERAGEPDGQCCSVQ